MALWHGRCAAGVVAVAHGVIVDLAQALPWWPAVPFACGLRRSPWPPRAPPRVRWTFNAKFLEAAMANKEIAGKGTVPDPAAAQAAAECWHSACVDGMLLMQKIQTEAFLGLQRSFLAANREIWDSWTCRFGGGVPIE
jgi:hypothetical protein